MKIKMIDLFVKMARGEKLPEKIKYNDNIYYLSENRVALHKYQTKGSNTTRKLSLIIDNEYLNLNDYVEIIEEPKKIKKIDTQYFDDERYTPEQRLNVCMSYIDDLIDEINNLKEK